jgi:hypothetical protein
MEIGELRNERLGDNSKGPIHTAMGNFHIHQSDANTALPSLLVYRNTWNRFYLCEKSI